MERVHGIGGVFQRAKDPAALQRWYLEHLGIAIQFETGTVFRWQDPDDPQPDATTVWGLFPAGTDYFGPSMQATMINYRVRDLDAMLEQLRAAGVEVDDRIETMEFGRFGWAVDLEGNRFELWEPAAGN